MLELLPFLLLLLLRIRGRGGSSLCKEGTKDASARVLKKTLWQSEEKSRSRVCH
ncbi:unnamed protein product [Natator depressus]